MLSVEFIKRYLPEVAVDGEPGWRVAGRENRFATVYHPQTGEAFEVAWATLANVLNSGSSIIR
jgi:hypothetical protein